MSLPRYVRELGDLEKRWALSEHEFNCDPLDHGLEAHEPFDVEEGDQSWPEFMARLERHGLRLIPIPAPSSMTGGVQSEKEPKVMRVLVACEFSGIVRDAFIAAGHDAWSVDFLPSERPGPHMQDDIRDVLFDALDPDGIRWDLMIAFPPCTHLAVSGARWFADKREEQEEALAFVRALLDAPIPHIALENPISVISSRIRKPDQILQPWQYGHGEVKATCLWLKNLPKLQPTNIVEGRTPRVHHAAPSPDRWKDRSRTLPGIAAAMAEQWGAAVQSEKGRQR